MSKLTTNQLTVLSAAARTDGLVIFPEGMKRGVASKIAASLIDRKLLREVRARPGMPVWREDDSGRKASLVIARAGRDIVEQLDNAEDIKSRPAAPERPGEKFTQGLAAAPARPAIVPKPRNRRIGKFAGFGATPIASVVAAGRDAAVTTLPVHPRPGSKQAVLVNMLSSPEGATIGAIASLMTWLSHTTRAALTDLRRRGFSLVRTPRDRLPSLYSISNAALETSSTDTPEATPVAAPVAKPPKSRKRA